MQELKLNMILQVLPGHYVVKIKVSLRFWERAVIQVIIMEKKLVRNSPGLGYVLGDEGSGAYLGKKSSTILFISNIRCGTA